MQYKLSLTISKSAALATCLVAVHFCQFQVCFTGDFRLPTATMGFIIVV